MSKEVTLDFGDDPSSLDEIILSLVRNGYNVYLNGNRDDSLCLTVNDSDVEYIEYIRKKKK